MNHQQAFDLYVEIPNLGGTRNDDRGSGEGAAKKSNDHGLDFELDEPGDVELDRLGSWTSSKEETM
jgi:hypothetical protein